MFHLAGWTGAAFFSSVSPHYSLQCSGVNCNATDNNGNLRKQEVYIPGDDQDQASTRTTSYQQYDYDELNRLARVHEYTGDSSKDWQQEYVYDRWGLDGIGPARYAELDQLNNAVIKKRP